MIANAKRNIGITTIPVFKTIPSDAGATWFTMPTGKAIIITARNKMIKQSTKEIIRNDQKFFADALKNSPAENLPEDRSVQ